MNLDLFGVLRRLSNACPPLTYLFIPAAKLGDRIRDGSHHALMKTSLEVYCTPEQRQDGRYMRRLKRDMWYCLIRYYCPFNEYFLFRFPMLSHEGRKTFISDYSRTKIAEKLSDEDIHDLFKDKARCYATFRPFFRRDVLKVDTNTSFEDFSAFLEKHSRLIVKPRNGSLGRGIQLLDVAALQRPVSELFRELQTLDGIPDTTKDRSEISLRRRGAFLEEPIVQSEAMARFHPQSVNTVRCTTFLKDGTVHILFAYLRMGQGGSLVDNAGAGGLSAAIDPDTGIIFTPAVSKTALESYLAHPDTGAQIIGARISRWDELKEMAAQLAAVVPQQEYVGWDLALTDDGWVLVEANNAAQMGCIQITTQRGLRPLLGQYINL